MGLGQDVMIFGEKSEDLTWQVGLWQHWANVLQAPTNTIPYRPYHPTIQSKSECCISPQNIPCTAESTPTSHPERTPSKGCRLHRQWWDCWPVPNPLPTVRQYQNYRLLSARTYTLHNIWKDQIHNYTEHPPTICQPRIHVTRLSDVWGTKKGKDKGEKYTDTIFT